MNENSLKNLRPPWRSGESGNPKGSPKGERPSTILKRYLAIKNRNEITKCEQIVLKLIDKAEDGDLSAIKEVFDRVEGKPGQSITVKEKTIDYLETLTDEQLKERAKEIIEKLNYSGSL